MEMMINKQWMMNSKMNNNIQNEIFDWILQESLLTAMEKQEEQYKDKIKILYQEIPKKIQIMENVLIIPRTGFCTNEIWDPIILAGQTNEKKY